MLAKMRNKCNKSENIQLSRTKVFQHEETFPIWQDIDIEHTNIHSRVFQAQNSFKKCRKFSITQRILEHHETILLTQGELPYLEKHHPIPILELENPATKLYQCKACPDMFLACSTCQSALFCKELPHNLSLSKPVFPWFILLCGQPSF